MYIHPKYLILLLYNSAHHALFTQLWKCTFFYIIRYHFEVSNSLGSVKGSVVLEVQEGEGKDGNVKELSFDSNPVTQKEFGEYVASLHSCNNSTFILQYQVQLHICPCKHACRYKLLSHYSL